MMTKKRYFRPQCRNHSARGVAAVWVTLWLTLLILIIGLGVDLGKISLGMHQLQNAADSAALAGAQVVKFDQGDTMKAACSAVASQNNVYGVGVELNDADIIPGYWSHQTRTFSPSAEGPYNAVRVIARRTTAQGGPISLLFGQFAGKPTSDVVCDAIAWSTSTTGAGLIALSRTGTGLSLSGGPTVDVNNGDVQVNSGDLSAAGYANGNFFVNADEFNVVGEVGGPADWDSMATTNGFSLNSAPVVPVIEDPLLQLEEPVLTDLDLYNTVVGGIDYSTALDIKQGDPDGDGVEGIIISPGYYPNGIVVSSGGMLTMEPGVYAIGPGAQKNINSNNPPNSLLISGGGTLNAEGVMLFLTHAGDSSYDYGVLNIQGGSYVTLKPLDHNPPAGKTTYTADYNPNYRYDGINVFQARANTYFSQITGTDQEHDIEGTIYFPNNLVKIGGTGLSLGNQLIADKIDVAGTAHVTINYDGRNFVKGFRSLLVE